MTEHLPLSEPGTHPRVVRSCLVILAVVAAGAALYWLRDILTPLALAIFLLIMIDGLARGIGKRTRLSDRASGALAILLVLLGFAGSVWIIIEGAVGFIADAADAVSRLDVIIADVARMIGLQVAPTLQDLIGDLDVRSHATRLALQVQDVTTGAFLVLIYLGFLLASQMGFRKKLVSMFPDRARRHEATEIFDRVRAGVQGYLWVQAVTGLMICAVAYGLMMIVGLDNALFLTFVLFVVGFIPLIGGVVAGLAPPLFALVQFDTYWQALVLLIGLQAVIQPVGNYVQPRMQGHNQNLDPVTVLLALAFWGKLWGVIGMFLSTPLAVMAMAILAEFRGSRWIAVLMSGDGEPYAKPRTPPEP